MEHKLVCSEEQFNCPRMVQGAWPVSADWPAGACGRLCQTCCWLELRAGSGHGALGAEYSMTGTGRIVKRERKVLIFTHSSSVD